VAGEITRGECVGEMGIFTDEPRSASIYAIRDSQLVRFSQAAIDDIVKQFPRLLVRITQIIIQRLRKTLDTPPASTSVINIALMPASPEVPLSEFAARLNASLSAYGPTLCMDRARIESIFNLPGIAETHETDPSNMRLNAWLHEQETQHRFVIYQTDSSDTHWTHRCLRNADQIVIVGQADLDPVPSHREATLLYAEDSLSRARRLLVLLHEDTAALPSNTPQWLTHRQIDNHQHIRWPREDDFQRLSRRINGHALGLVLGGGGARGLAHIGILRAFEEKQIPIDMIGGTSIGAIIAALYAMGHGWADIRDIIRKSFLEIKPLSEYTFPLIAVLRSQKLDRVIHMAFQDINIEDLWLNFFCVSSNLS
jgi:NTE family protein/lysophospholipid hydrolase